MAEISDAIAMIKKAESDAEQLIIDSESQSKDLIAESKVKAEETISRAKLAAEDDAKDTVLMQKIKLKKKPNLLLSSPKKKFKL